MNKLIKKVLVGITAATMMFGSVCTDSYAATSDNLRASNRKGFTKDNKERVLQ